MQENNLNVRKLIKFGNSSYVVSLPNSWIRKNELKKGDNISLLENGSEIVISSRDFNEARQLSEISLDASDKDVKDISREIVSSYIHGYDIIRIRGGSPRINKSIRNIVYSLIGLEIIDQDKDLFSVRNLISLKDISIEKSIRRADTLLRSIMEDTKTSYKTDNFEYISERDRDVNRITFLLLRLIKISADNPKTQKALKLDVRDMFNLWALIVYLEEMADECKRIASLYVKLRGNKKINFKQFDKLLDDLYKFYVDIMKSYYKRDRKLAYAIASKSRNIFNFYGSLLEESTNIYEASLIEKFKNLSTSIRNISRVIYQW